MTTVPQTGSLRFFRTGETVLRQGERGLCAYIIEEGEVEVLIERLDGSVERIGTRGPGSIVGEMSLVDEAPRVATVNALTDCKMLEVTQGDFARLLKTADPLIQMVTQVILTRFRETLTREKTLGVNLAAPPTEMLAHLNVVRSDAVAALRLATEFKQALADGDLALHYQPIVDLCNGEIAGFEALMRWARGDKGYLSPGDFIPVAEKSDLIIEASQWVLRESCNALKRIEESCRFVLADRRQPLYISINISGADLAYEGFTDNLFATLSEMQVPPGQVSIEITERLLIEQPLHARRVLSACRNAGMYISIDDFGTGYSSLSYLHYFRVDALKIDESFIQGLARDESTSELLKAIISLGKSMKLKVVVEGVENAKELRMLQSAQCDMAQGFYFAKPMSEIDAARLLRDWQPQAIMS